MLLKTALVPGHWRTQTSVNENSGAKSKGSNQTLRRSIAISSCRNILTNTQSPIMMQMDPLTVVSGAVSYIYLDIYLSGHKSTLSLHLFWP